jgi:drug/metabolite transporter (DMT)-like permease
MTMHRRPVSRGRRLAAFAALLMLGGCLLPWYTFVGDLPVNPFRAFDGSGILVFVAGLAALALLALPYAAGDRPVGLDRWIAFALIFAVAFLGILLWPFQFLDEPAGLLPDRAPGYWLATVGVLALARAAFDIAREPAPR